MVLVIDLLLLTILVGISGTIWHHNYEAWKDPNYCMLTPSSFLYSVAAGHTGWNYNRKTFWLAVVPLIAGSLFGLWSVGAHITFYALVLLQVVALVTIFVSLKFKLVKPCN